MVSLDTGKEKRGKNAYRGQRSGYHRFCYVLNGIGPAARGTNCHIHVNCIVHRYSGNNTTHADNKIGEILKHQGRQVYGDKDR